jgi:hypothetical protein
VLPDEHGTPHASDANEKKKTAKKSIESNLFISCLPDFEISWHKAWIMVFVPTLSNLITDY